MEKAGVDLEVRIYPSASLFKPKQQWDAMTKGQLDISAFPLDYASGRHPQFSATLMPGLVKNHDHAKRLNTSDFMADIKKIIDEAGVVVLSDAWLAGGFVGKDFCVTTPESVTGKVMRAAGPAFEQMLAEAGASINSMPSSVGDLQRDADRRAGRREHLVRLVRQLPHLRAGQLPDPAGRLRALVHVRADPHVKALVRIAEPGAAGRPYGGR